MVKSCSQCIKLTFLLLVGFEGSYEGVKGLKTVTLYVLRLNDSVVASRRSAALDDVVELKMGIKMVL